MQYTWIRILQENGIFIENWIASQSFMIATMLMFLVRGSVINRNKGQQYYFIYSFWLSDTIN